MNSTLRVKDTDALASDAEAILSAYFVDSPDTTSTVPDQDVSNLDSISIATPVSELDLAAQEARAIRRKQKKEEKRAKRKEESAALKRLQASSIQPNKTVSEILVVEVPANECLSSEIVSPETATAVASPKSSDEKAVAETKVELISIEPELNHSEVDATHSVEQVVTEPNTFVEEVVVESTKSIQVEPKNEAATAGNLFSDLGLPEEICSALLVAGYVTPTGIQAATIPQLLQGRDVLGQAQTGTGKTAAFALPLLSRINVNNPSTQVLVLAPTRELAIQVAESFERYGQHLKGLQVAAIYGGSSYTTQINALRRGAHIVVGTPGRVMDHMRENRLRIDKLQCLVLDEADEMLRMGFVDDVRWVLEQSPPQVQIALFSATMPNAIREIADRHLKNPHVISIDASKRTAATIRQRFVLVEQRAKLDALHRILLAEETDGVIVFVKTKIGTVELAESLTELGHSAVAINGDVAQNQRERCIEQLKQGTFNVLVATDVAARGLDVQRITHVINFDLPFDAEAYVHRIGRTGRAGRTGEAIVFLSPRQRGFLREIDRAAGHQIDSMEVPTAKEINAIRIARFKSHIVAACEANAAPTREFGTFAKIVEECIAENSLDAAKVATALAFLSHGNQPFLLDENPRRTSHRDSFHSASDDSRGRSSDRRSSRDSGESRSFNDRKPRRDRNSGGVGEAGSEFMSSEKERFRVEVGSAHGVRPGNLVGAIANEIGLDSSYIGQIAIFDEFSTVDLPSGMPRDLFKTLGRAWVVGRQLRISKLSDHPNFRSDRPRRREL